MVNTAAIIGIFDIENTSVSKDTRDFLRNQGAARYEVVNVSYEMPKTFVVCTDPESKETVVYISPISAATLRKRLQQNMI